MQCILTDVLDAIANHCIDFRKCAKRTLFSHDLYNGCFIYIVPLLIQQTVINDKSINKRSQDENVCAKRHLNSQIIRQDTSD